MNKVAPIMALMCILSGCAGVAYRGYTPQPFYLQDYESAEVQRTKREDFRSKISNESDASARAEIIRQYEHWRDGEASDHSADYELKKQNESIAKANAKQEEKLK